MKTRDRILACALELFNEQGEPNVTTLEIANELNISPGNLYYHFKGKEALLEALLEAFLEHTRGLLRVEAMPDELEPEDYWLFLHLLLEAIITYRFLFQDLSNLMGRHTFIQRAMRQWLQALRQSLEHLLHSLQRSGALTLDDDSLLWLLDNQSQTLLFWFDYQRIAYGDEQADPVQAVIQVMSPLQPYLASPAQEWWAMLILRYRRQV
ncbi:TetR/AcrR family transcriptional regulator [Pseudomonas jilinensis]|uniref:TetR family transcriptional regulator n=1 Tax=Pseudomonas jilinensis TaxID=2078689 RepID=A0A396RV31_9PSED|nr:TetR/AcrR family transcriptional regulator [Pseudomonas jilinensis]RHW20484.1 TetR family transcriptional regulator [Pseudomonas jilinensis]